MPRPAASFRLPPGQHAELRARLQQATMAPRLRVRLQCVQLRDQGQTVPQIAEQLAVSQATVRRALRRVVAGGLDGLADRPRSGRPARLGDQDLDALEELLRQAAPRGGRCGPWVSWPRGWPAAVACGSAVGGWARCCGRVAAAGHRPTRVGSRRPRAASCPGWSVSGCGPAGGPAAGSWPGRSRPRRSPGRTRSPC